MFIYMTMTLEKNRAQFCGLEGVETPDSEAGPAFEPFGRKMNQRTIDANGNLIRDDQKTYTWDAANRLIEVLPDIGPAHHRCRHHPYGLRRPREAGGDHGEARGYGVECQDFRVVRGPALPGEGCDGEDGPKAFLFSGRTDQRGKLLLRQGPSGEYPGDDGFQWGGAGGIRL